MSEDVDNNKKGKDKDEDKEEQEKKDSDPRQYADESPGDDVDRWDNSAQEVHWKGKYASPPVPHVDAEGRAPEKVNTEALAKFATNVRTLVEPLDKVYKDLGTVQVPAGAEIFQHATDLERRVLGAGGGAQDNAAVVPSTRDFVLKAINAARAIADEADALARLYAETEDQNKISAEALDAHIRDAQGYVTSATGTPGPA